MSQQAATIVACPTCKRSVPWVVEQQFKPFCSQRCKLIDLGDWATEAHKIPGPAVISEFEVDQFEADD